MEFNKNWTKLDNDKLRDFIKEGKDSDFIRNYFSNDKLFYNPNKKYYRSGKSASIPTFKKQIDDFTGFINEIKYESLKTDFQVDFEKSTHFADEFNYIYKFQTYSGNRYVIDFIYIKDFIGPYPNKDIYNISFTLERNRNLNNQEEYEKITSLHESHEIIKRLIFIFNNFETKYGSGLYLLGETENLNKINWYRNLIKDSFPNIKETEGESSFTNGLKAYYFEIL